MKISRRNLVKSLFVTATFKAALLSSASANPIVWFFRLIVGNSGRRVAGRAVAGRTLGREATRRAATKNYARRAAARRQPSALMQVVDNGFLAADAAYIFQMISPEVAYALEDFDSRHPAASEKPKIWAHDLTPELKITGVNAHEERLGDYLNLSVVDYETGENLGSLETRIILINPLTEFSVTISDTAILPQTVPGDRFVKVVGSLESFSDLIAIDDSGPIYIAKAGSVIVRGEH